MDRIEKAIMRIQSAYEMAEHAGNTLVCAYSGGKDSDVLLDLCKKSDVPFVATHNHTTVDAPESVYHIRETYFGLIGSRGRIECKGNQQIYYHSTGEIAAVVNFPKISMWAQKEKKLMPPTRLVRYCCDYLKERKFDNQHLLLGVRWAESGKRKNNRGLHEALGSRKAKIVYQDENDDSHKLTEICMKNNRIATNPIIDWTDREVWNYTRENKLKMNPLYECGYMRVGCVGCPLASNKNIHMDFERYPKYKKAYILAFEKMLVARREQGKDTGEGTGKWKDAESVFKWWTNPKYDPNQLTLDDV
jgi:phosphoadenosine phosphosulfate reductase